LAQGKSYAITLEYNSKESTQLTINFKTAATKWIDANEHLLSDFHERIWNFAEPALREYKSAYAYVKMLEQSGFKVERGAAGMPTAFVATWGEEKPVIGTYAEYDAVPGNSQKAVTHKEPVIPYAPGHTDPHSALGVAALAAILATRESMKANNIKGTLRIFGTPAEKICVGKPYLAARGYFDDHDAFVCNHPWSNTTVHYETGLGSYWNAAFTFECAEPEKWITSQSKDGAIYASHRDARCPGALDALCLMYTSTRYTKEAMIPFNGLWSLNEVVLVGGQSTADNLSPELSVISYASRTPSLEHQEQIFKVLENNAKTAAATTGSTYKIRWVTKTRTSLPNTTLAEIAYDNLQQVGPPRWSSSARELVKDTFKNAGLNIDGLELFEESLTPPREWEHNFRQSLPMNQSNWLSDDFTEFTWHAPSVWIHVARAPKPIPQKYPQWIWVATGGMKDVINPTIFTTAKTMSGTMLDLLTKPEQLSKCQAEFRARKSKHNESPLLSADIEPPIELRWPEYVTTPRGEDWWIPSK
jgi:aminobenzoyl-glutamate utilization protein B